MALMGAVTLDDDGMLAALFPAARRLASTHSRRQCHTWPLLKATYIYANIEQKAELLFLGLSRLPPPCRDSDDYDFATWWHAVADRHDEQKQAGRHGIAAGQMTLDSARGRHTISHDWLVASPANTAVLLGRGHGSGDQPIGQLARTAILHPAILAAPGTTRRQSRPAAA